MVVLLIEDINDSELIALLNQVVEEWRMVEKALRPEDISESFLYEKNRADKLRDKYNEIISEIRRRNLSLSKEQLVNIILREY